MMEDHRIAINERVMKNKQDTHDKKFMYMNPTKLDENAKQYFEYMCDQVLASKTMFMGGGYGEAFIGGYGGAFGVGYDGGGAGFRGGDVGGDGDDDGGGTGTSSMGGDDDNDSCIA
jgi:hypothetical protein